MTGKVVYLEVERIEREYAPKKLRPILHQSLDAPSITTVCDLEEDSLEYVADVFLTKERHPNREGNVYFVLSIFWGHEYPEPFEDRAPSPEGVRSIVRRLRKNNPGLRLDVTNATEEPNELFGLPKEKT